jgi:heat shock protein HslJ
LTIDEVSSSEAGAAACPTRFAAAPLEGTYWRITHVGEVPLSAADTTQGHEPALTFRGDAATFAATAGCRRVAGNYRSTGELLMLEAVGTLAACPDGARADARVESMLRDVRRYRILGQLLELYDVNHRLLARLEAREAN